ncbi:hypothetical protein Tco_0110660 [Tanacetum coccineum]
MQEVVLFYNGLDVPNSQILYSRGAIPSKTAADVKVVIQEMAEYSQKWHNRISRTRSTETFDGLATIQAQLNNLGREIKKVNEKVYATQIGCNNEQVPGTGKTKIVHSGKKGKPSKKLTTLNLGLLELNDLNVPLELRRDQVDDLMPTIKEGEVVKEFRARNDARMVSKVFGYPSNCDHDKKIHIDCAYNLKFSCMIGDC